MVVRGRLVSLWMEMVRFYGICYDSPSCGMSKFLLPNWKGKPFISFLQRTWLVERVSSFQMNECWKKLCLLCLVDLLNSPREWNPTCWPQFWLHNLCKCFNLPQKKILCKWYASTILMVFSSLWALNSLLLLCIILNGVQWVEVGILKALLVCCF